MESLATVLFARLSLFPIFRNLLAECERFELSRAPYTPTPLAAEPLRPLGYHSESKNNMRESVAERVGFEPTARCRVTGFQDQLLKPLGHLSECY